MLQIYNIRRFTALIQGIHDYTKGALEAGRCHMKIYEEHTMSQMWLAQSET